MAREAAVRTHTVEPIAEGRRRPAPHRAPRPGTGTDAVLRLQRLAGNQAVRTLVAGQGGATVQRCGQGPCDCPAEEHPSATTVKWQAGNRTIHRLATGGPSRTALFPAQGAGDPSAASDLIQRKPTEAEEAAFAFANPGKVTDVGDTTGGSDTLGTAEPNEFVLWNYLVGKGDLRPGHIAALGPVAARWVALLQANPSLRVKAVGSASTTGSAAGATPLSIKRAEALKRFLVGRGIPESAIVVAGVGSRQPLADETTPEGMARNRRVELFLFRPTTTVDELPAASAEVLNERINIGSTFTRTLDPAQNFVALRHRAMTASATVEGFGAPGSQVGYLQFVRDDKRIGRYTPVGGGQGFTLDFSRCTSQYLPCKDVAESMQVFSSRPLTLLPGPSRTSGTIAVSDTPGVVFPLQVRNPRAGRLAELEWSMEFVCVLGVRSGDSFQALEHFVWRVDAVHSNAASPSPVTKEAALLVAAGMPGAPAGLDIERAMDLQTCRFTMRRIEAGPGDERQHMCQPELL